MTRTPAMTSVAMAVTYDHGEMGGARIEYDATEPFALRKKAAERSLWFAAQAGCDIDRAIYIGDLVYLDEPVFNSTPDAWALGHEAIPDDTEWKNALMEFLHNADPAAFSVESHPSSDIEGFSRQAIYDELMALADAVDTGPRILESGQKRLLNESAFFLTTFALLVNHVE